MEVEPDILFMAKKAVGRMPLEVVPHLLDGVELRGITGKPFEMEPGIRTANRVDERPLVNTSPVPDQNDVSSQMLKEQA